MEILGHSQIGVTLNLYSHVSPEVALGAADRIENVLWTDRDALEDEDGDDDDNDSPTGPFPPDEQG